MEPFLAEVKIFAGNFAPRGWALCEGQILPINQNQALFSLLGTTYGGDGRTTFALPDLRGRAPISSGQGPGLSNRNLGSRGGQPTHTLTQNEMPAHNHTVHLNVSTSVGSENSPSGNHITSHSGAFSEDATSGTNIQGAITNNTGGGQPHNNMQPYLALNYIIALQGVFPSRN